VAERGEVRQHHSGVVKGEGVKVRFTLAAAKSTLRRSKNESVRETVRMKCTQDRVRPAVMRQRGAAGWLENKERRERKRLEV